MKSNKNLQNSNYSNQKPINPNKTFKKPINQLFGATGGSGYGKLWEALEALGGSGMKSKQKPSKFQLFLWKVSKNFQNSNYSYEKYANTFKIPIIPIKNQ